MLQNNGIHSYEDARRLAKKRLPWMVFDYIDGAAGTEAGEQFNRDEIQKIRLQPRILNNVVERNIKPKLFGKKVGYPLVSVQWACAIWRVTMPTNCWPNSQQNTTFLSGFQRQHQRLLKT